MTRYNHGDTIQYEARFEDAAGVGITNADGKVVIRRQSDDNYWNGSTWQVAPFLLSMTDVDIAADTPGVWRYAFNTTPHLSTDAYVAEITDANMNAINTPFNLIEAIVGGYLDGITSDLGRVLALQHDNFVMDPLTYDVNGSMLTGVVRAYDSKANADLDDGATGLLYTYDIVGIRTTEGYLGKYTQTRTL